MIVGESNSDLLDRLTTSPREALGELVRRAGEPTAVVSQLSDEAERLAITDLARAVAATELLVLASDQAAPPSARARARRARAQALAYSNRFEDALIVLREAIALADSAGDAMEGARARMTTLHALARLGRYAEAVEAGEAARATFSAANEAVLAARADINLGVSWRMSGQPARSLPHFDRAKVNLAGQTILLAQLESNRAEALLDLGLFADAEAAFHCALKEFETAGLSRASGIVEGNLGDLTNRQGRLQEALAHFERARRKLGESDAPGDAARLEIEQAEALSSVGLSDEAIHSYEHAIPRLREHNLAWEAARGLLGLGRELVRRGREKRATDVLREASLSFEQLGHGAGVGLVRVQEARLAARSGNRAGAEMLLSAAIGLLHDRGPELVSARIERSLTLLSMDRFADAEREGAVALEGAAALSLTLLRAAALHAQALMYSRTDRPRNAVDALKEAIEHIESVRSHLSIDRVRASFHDGFASVYAACLTALLDLREPDGVAEAFGIAERASARSLLDLLDAGPGLAAVGLTPDVAECELIARLGRERAALAAHHDRLFGDSSRRESRERVGDWKRTALECEQTVRDIERRLATTSRFADAFGEPVQLQALQSRLEPGVGMIQFVAEGDDLSVFAVDRNECHVRRRVASLSDVGEAVAALYFQLFRVISRGACAPERARRLTSDCERVLGQLRDLVLLPVAPFVQAHPRLAIVPHSVLHAVPFHAVVGSMVKGTDDRCVAIVPSASVLARLLDRAPAPGGSSGLEGDVLVIGVSDELSPQAEQEAASIVDGLPGARVLLRGDATIGACRLAMEGKRHIHIASHARFVPSDPLSSGIRLADGWMTAREVFGLNLRNSTIVLSGCDSGRAIVGASNEANGLVRAFLAAGASEVLMSLWPVHDEVTSQLMKSLYTTGGTEGPSPSSHAKGLCRAQRLVRDHEPHPALWAPFVRIGVP